MHNKEHYKLMNRKIDIATVKQQADCQMTAGRVGRSGGDKRSTEGLVCMHISTTNGHKTLRREGMYGRSGVCVGHWKAMYTYNTLIKNILKKEIFRNSRQMSL